VVIVAAIGLTDVFHADEVRPFLQTHSPKIGTLDLRFAGGLRCVFNALVRNPCMLQL
jgi:hypothetical protein